MYQKHCENLTELEEAIKSVEMDLRRYISTEKEDLSRRYTMLLAYLVVCWAEVRILKLVHEHGFTPIDCQLVRTIKVLENKWITSLEISICKAYQINRVRGFENQLPPLAKQRYLIIKQLIKKELVPSITVRNRIAHGQWKHVFNSTFTAVSVKNTSDVQNQNIVKLQLQHKLIKILAQLIHDLAVSPPTFERDFDRNYSLIENNLRNLRNRSYLYYKIKMVDKFKRGNSTRIDNELKTKAKIDKVITTLRNFKIAVVVMLAIIVITIILLLVK